MPTCINSNNFTCSQASEKKDYGNKNKTKYLIIISIPISKYVFKYSNKSTISQAFEKRKIYETCKLLEHLFVSCTNWCTFIKYTANGALYN